MQSSESILVDVFLSENYPQDFQEMREAQTHWGEKPSPCNKEKANIYVTNMKNSYRRLLDQSYFSHVCTLNIMNGFVCKLTFRWCEKHRNF